MVIPTTRAPYSPAAWTAKAPQPQPAGATRNELIAELTSAYGIATEQAAGDVDALRRELSSRSLLAARPAPG
ncbi:MAG: hypothetical protein ACR2KV_00055 [Solirubrobacteraceae bacterium]